MLITCVLIHHFAAAVERRADPTLAGLPLVIASQERRPGRVYAVSGEAACTGVRPGMPLRQAQALCPDARCLPADPARYHHAFAELLEVLAGFTSLVEPADSPWQIADGRWLMDHLPSAICHPPSAIRHRPSAIGYLPSAISHPPSAICYLDLGHLTWVGAVTLVQHIAQAVREQTRLAPAIGLAGGKFPAYTAATAVEPNEGLLIAPGHEAAFLAPRPVTLLPLEREAARRLWLMGIRTLGQFAALPTGAVLAQLGPPGRWLHHLAQGQDGRRVRPYRPQPVERVSRRFESPLTDQLQLEAIGRVLAEALAERLQARGWVGRELRWVLDLEDGTTLERALVLRQPTARAESIAGTLGSLLAQRLLACGVVGLEVSVTGLVPCGGEQLNLFVPLNGQVKRLQAVLKDLVARYGAHRFYQITRLDPQACLLERRFCLKTVEEP